MGREDGPDRRPEQGETVIEEGWRIAVAPNASDTVGVAKDFQDYLFTSMGISTLLVRDERAGKGRTIRLTTKADSPDLGKELSVARGYRILVEPDSITVCGCDERGTAQGCYHLEDLMNLREAPFLAKMDAVRAPLFSPRMVHSGWGIDQFPDQHLNAIAHAGMDAILVFVKGPNTTTTGHLDINNLIDRAAAYGIDVYLYSYLISRVHPDAPRRGVLREHVWRAYPLVSAGEGTRLRGRVVRVPEQRPAHPRVDPQGSAARRQAGFPPEPRMVALHRLSPVARHGEERPPKVQPGPRYRLLDTTGDGRPRRIGWR